MDQEETLLSCFMKTCENVWDERNTLSPETMLRLYGLHKQVYVGDCNIPKPSILNFKECKKWEAWRALQGMGQKDAMEGYIEEFRRHKQTLLLKK